MLDGCAPWPTALADRYRQAGHWRGEVLGDLTRATAAADPGRTALVAGETRVAYGALDARADRLAAGLADLGIRPRDRVVVALPNVPAFAEVSLACFRLGAVPVYALPAHRRAELEYLCERAAARALVVPDAERGFDFRPMAAAIRDAVPALEHLLIAGDPGTLPTALDAVDAEPRDLPSPEPGEVAFLLLSGGTTGLPKLIPRTHDDYAYQLRATAAVVGASRDSVYLAALPVAHNAALGCPGLLGTLRAGGRVLLAASPSPDEIFPLVALEGPTLTTVMPTFLLLWSETAAAFGADLSRLHIEVGGAGLDPGLARAAQRALGCTLTHWFGMAEGVLCCTRAEDDVEAAATTQGRPICPDDELLVVDEHDRPVPRGTEGELLVRGPMTIRGYYDEAEHNARAFTAQGFMRTGDLVRRSATGALTVTGRIKDVINRGGEKISTGEVEEHLRAHPEVHDAALVGCPDPVLGERAYAFVVTGPDRPGLTELRRHLIERGIADYKLPDRVEQLSELPRTSLGKPDKAALRAALGMSDTPLARVSLSR
jgi:2,3-dihydroxybenzoate-AMP ligase